MVLVGRFNPCGAKPLATNRWFCRSLLPAKGPLALELLHLPLPFHFIPLPPPLAITRLHGLLPQLAQQHAQGEKHYSHTAGRADHLDDRGPHPVPGTERGLGRGRWVVLAREQGRIGRSGVCPERAGEIDYQEVLGICPKTLFLPVKDL